MSDSTQDLFTKGHAHELRVQDTVLQVPGTDTCIKKVAIAGPSQTGDRRLYLSVRELESLLKVAKASLTRRAIIHRVGIQVKLFQTGSGHAYEVWTLLGGEVKAESPPLVTPV